MHELGMCEGVVEAVERRARGRRVTRLRLRVGNMHRVVPEAFGQAFEMAAAGSVAQGAEVDLNFIPVRTACRSCGAESESEDFVPLCQGCGSADVEIVGGQELMLESLEYAALIEDQVQDEVPLEEDDHVHEGDHVHGAH